MGASLLKRGLAMPADGDKRELGVLVLLFFDVVFDVLAQHLDLRVEHLNSPVGLGRRQRLLQPVAQQGYHLAGR